MEMEMEGDEGDPSLALVHVKEDALSVLSSIRREKKLQLTKKRWLMGVPKDFKLSKHSFNYLRKPIFSADIELQKTSARKHTSQFNPISLENFDDLEPWIEEEPATIFDDEDLECFNLEAEATEGFVDEGESASATAGAEYVGEDLPILDDEDDEEEDDE